MTMPIHIRPRTLLLALLASGALLFAFSKRSRRLLQLRRECHKTQRQSRLLVSDGYRRPADRDVHKPVVDAAAHENCALHRAVRRRRAPILAAARQDVDRSCRSRPPTGARGLLPLRVHADENAKRGGLPARRPEVHQAVPACPPVPAVERGQPWHDRRSRQRQTAHSARLALGAASPRSTTGR